MIQATYRVGHACFSDWLLTELARQAHDAKTAAEPERPDPGLLSGERIGPEPSSVLLTPRTLA